MSFAVAASEAPSTADAATAVAAGLAASLRDNPAGVVLFFATTAHLEEVDILASVLSNTLAPKALVGAVASSIIAGNRELEEVPGVVAWAAPLTHAVPVRLPPALTEDHSPILDLPVGEDETHTLLLLADPYSYPADRLLGELATEAPEMRVVGGLVSAANEVGGNRLVCGRQVFDDGAVGLLLGGGAAVETVVSQGCRPVGQPYVVTRGEHNLIHELGGQSVSDRLREIIPELPGSMREMAQRGLQIGIVVNEHKLNFERGDFLVRSIFGLERESGALAVGDVVETGTTVQFHVRDAPTARKDLSQLMAGRQAEGALIFTCNGRGRRLFQAADQDASIVSEALAPAPVAGMFCVGEIGPVGRRSYLHGFTASVALFRQDPGQ